MMWFALGHVALVHARKQLKQNVAGHFLELEFLAIQTKRSERVALHFWRFVLSSEKKFAEFLGIFAKVDLEHLSSVALPILLIPV